MITFVELDWQLSFGGPSGLQNDNRMTVLLGT